MSTAFFILLVLAYAVLLTVLAVISAMETASFSVRDAGQQVARLQAGPLRDSIQAILANPFHHLHRTLLVSAALNLALTTLNLYVSFEPLRDMGHSPWLTLPLLFGTTVVLGDVLPKFAAIRSPAVVLLSTARLLQPLRVVLDPLATLAERASDRALQVMVPKGVQIRQPITVDELETLIEMRQEQGAIDSSEAAILGEVIDICDLTVRDCMVPRVDLTLVEAAKPEAKILDALERTEARFVVIHGETPDSVQGIVDSHEWKSAGRPKWTTLVQQPVFVPETFPALDALTQHLTSQKQCVLISDEYGGLEGMVTQDEVVDWLLYDAAPWQGEAAELRALDDEGRRYLVDGAARLDDISETLDLPLEAPGIDTVGGYVFNHLGYLPKPGERVKLEHLEIKVRRVARRRIQQVELRVTRETTSTQDSQPLTA